MIKLLLLFPAFLVMGLQTPYLLQAWNSSRLDHWDWLFYLCTVPAVLWAIRSEKKGRYDWYDFPLFRYPRSTAILATCPNSPLGLLNG